MKNFLLSIFAVLFAFAGVQAQETVTDVLSATKFAATGTSYEEFSGVSFTSDAVYAGNSAKTSGGAIQLRSKNSNSGIVTTVSGGKAKSVTIEVESGTKTLDIYGSNTAYTSATDLYGDKKGTKLGSLNAGGTLEITGDYEYIGLRSNSGALYLTSISIVWETNGEGGEETPEAPAAPTLPAACNFDDAMTVEITGIAEGATAYYSLNNENNWVVGTSVEITETTTVYAKVVKDGVSSTAVSETYTKNTPVTPPAEGEVVDVINIQTIGIDSYGSYTLWTGVQSNSSAVYAGQSHKNGDAVQLRATSPSGIISTASAGKLKKIVVEWASNTTSGRTLNVYGKNTAYSTAADLYDASTQGTLLGTIVCGTTTELVIEGDYEYIGMRSNSGAMYLTSISITWDESAGVTPVAPNAPVLTESQSFSGSMTVTITSDATVYYTTDGTTPSKTNGTEYTAPFEITATTTVKAVAVNEVGESEVAEATYTYIEPIDLSDCTVAEAIEAYANGQTGPATITGYIVGAVPNGSLAQAEFTSETTVASNILIADDPNETDFAKCMPIKLASGTTVRNVLNLPGNKGVYKKKVAIECELGTYCSVAGTQNVSAAGIYWNVSEAGYATLYLGYKVVIPETVKAYLATGVADKYVELSEVTGILPANTGLILEGEGEHLFNITSSAATADVADNLLNGSVTDEYVAGDAYVLGNVDGVGLYKAVLNKNEAGEAGTTHFLNNANKAYLPASALTPAQQTAAFYGFDWDGTTGIEQITENREQSTAIYDLTGRRIDAITAPGIYVVNGKKILVK